MQASDRIKVQISNKKIRWLAFIFMLIPVLVTGSADSSPADGENGITAGTQTIAIDPGHGGLDKGSRGPDGSLEKEVTFNLAQILAKELKPDYTVSLTRNGDYQVELTQRASVANHHNADVFISLHAGAGSRHQADAWTIFYYEPSDSQGANMHPGKTVSEREDALPIPWDLVCLRHQKESRILAGCIKTQLAGDPKIRDVAVSRAPLRVLEGLDMPAIIIETGYLTNPKTEKQLNDPAFLSDIANRIKTGVDVYLTR